MTLLEEQQLVKEAQKNNESFSKLYDLYYPKIFGYIFRRTVDLELSKDITSETFIKAFINIGRFEWKNIPFSSWLFRIATNEMNMADRKKKYKPLSLQHLEEKNYPEMVDAQSLETEKLIVEKQLQQSDDFLQIQQKLMLLPMKYKEAISLRYFEEKSIKEIAEILNKNEGTVKSIISRGIDKLRKLM